MTRFVLDASALLAAIQMEPGHDRVRPVLQDGLVSPVNQAEVVSKLVERGVPPEVAVEIAGGLNCRVVAADATLGMRAGVLHARTKGGNISLGDRFCLALAEQEKLPVMTTDRAWTGLDLGVEVVLIR